MNYQLKRTQPNWWCMFCFEKLEPAQFYYIDKPNSICPITIHPHVVNIYILKVFKEILILEILQIRDYIAILIINSSLSQ